MLSAVSLPQAFPRFRDSTEQARSARAGDEREAPEGMMGTSTFLDKSIRDLSKDTRQPEMKSFLI